jgi:hypothetical protein
LVKQSIRGHFIRRVASSKVEYHIRSLVAEAGVIVATVGDCYHLK